MSALTNAVASGDRPIVPAVTYTFFSGTKQPVGQRRTALWSDLLTWIELQSPVAETKDELPLIKLATFAGDYRNDQNLEAVYGIEGDYDGGQMPPTEALALLQRAGVASLVYTSPSHRPDAPRWRVLCPLSRPYAANERREVVGRLNGLLGGCLALESFTPSQAFYVGSVAGGNPVQCWRTEGRAIDTVEGLPVAAPMHREGQRKRLGAGGSAPSYKIALAALLSRLPDDFDRNGWLAISGAFASAVYGLPGSESAETDWLQWNASYPKDDQAADSRTWADFRRNGSNCGWPELRGMAHIERMDANDAGWMFFGGTAVVLPALAIATKPPALSQVTTDFVDIKGRPRVVARPLVDGVLPAASVGMLYGAPKAGKTFVTLDLALSVATEQQWNGHAVKRNAGPVVYIAGEGHKGLRYRVEAWEAERGATIERGRIRFTDAAISFGDRNALAALQSDLDALPVKPSLIVVDTLFRATVGANVNDQEQMSKFWQVCEQISRHYGCTVLVVHHTNKSESATSFGSIVSEASVDFQIAVEWDQGSRCIRSRLTKDDEPFDDICFNLKSVAVGFVEYDDGGAAVIQSCVPEYVQSSRSGNNRHENAGAKAIGKSMLRAPRSKDAATVLYIMARIQSVGQGSAVITKEQIRSALREGISDREPAHIIRDGTKSLLTSGHILPHKGRDDAWSIKDDAFILAREDNFGVYENYEPKL